MRNVPLDPFGEHARAAKAAAKFDQVMAEAKAKESLNLMLAREMNKDAQFLDFSRSSAALSTKISRSMRDLHAIDDDAIAAAAELSVAGSDSGSKRLARRRSSAGDTKRLTRRRGSSVGGDGTNHSLAVPAHLQSDYDSDATSHHSHSRRGSISMSGGSTLKPASLQMSVGQRKQLRQQHSAAAAAPTSGVDSSSQHASPRSRRAGSVVAQRSRAGSVVAQRSRAGSVSQAGGGKAPSRSRRGSVVPKGGKAAKPQSLSMTKAARKKQKK
jgi:hypothetical protein